MKNSYYLVNFKNILLFIVLVLFAACEKAELNQNNENLDEYNEPNYPKKIGGRYLKSIFYKYRDYPSDLNFPFKSGVKVEFFYNSKNYVDYFKIYGFESVSTGRIVKIEYNITGLVSRIKYFDTDSIIFSYELFEYNKLKQLSKISNYEFGIDKINYELTSYNEFNYSSMDTVVELRYIKFNNFGSPFRDIYMYDLDRNIKEKIAYSPNMLYPYSSSEFYYNDKKRPFENLGLPIYEISYDYFQMSEILSKNHYIGSQGFSYDNNGLKTKFGDPQHFDIKYDNLNYPISRNETIFYNYIDLN